MAGSDKTGGTAILGIDLGTTRSVVAHVGPAGHVTCLPDSDGVVLTPSCVLIDGAGDAIVGTQARQAITTDPDRVIEAFKRHMGSDVWRWRTGGRSFGAVQLASILLERMAQDAARVVGPPGAVVITVPAYFGDRERRATIEAAHLAGLDVLNLINEPSAAALASAFDAYMAAGGDGTDLNKAAIASTAPGINVICDLGGGTFDVTVIRTSGSDFDILATGGERIGGRDFDDRIVDAMTRHVLDHGGTDPHHDLIGQAKMRLAAEQAKHTLSVSATTKVCSPYDVPPLTLARQHFEAISDDLIAKTKAVLIRVLEDAGLTWAHIEDVLLVGGASRMPMFRRMVAEVTGRPAQTRLQPDLIVAQGAAVYGAILHVQGETPLAPGANVPVGPAPEAADDVAIATEDALDPERASSLSPVAFEPGFAAAIGAVRLSDVTSRSLGVVVRSPRRNRKVNSVLIPRQTRLPASNTRVFATREPNQRRVCVPIVEGETDDPNECVELGRCVIDPLPPNLPKGSHVRVTFTYDTSGCVRVCAEELTTRQRAETVIERSVGQANPIDELAAAVDDLAHA